VTSRSGRGRWERVLAARKTAREALGHEPPGGEIYGAPKARTRLPVGPPEPQPIEWKPGDGVGVLTRGEAAERLGVSLSQLDLMIAAGTIQSLPTGYARMVPTSEIERLTQRP
jgi:excisionase family DNA binding protein